MTIRRQMCRVRAGSVRLVRRSCCPTAAGQKAAKHTHINQDGCPAAAVEAAQRRRRGVKPREATHQHHAPKAARRGRAHDTTRTDERRMSASRTRRSGSSRRNVSGCSRARRKVDRSLTFAERDRPPDFEASMDGHRHGPGDANGGTSSGGGADGAAAGVDGRRGQARLARRARKGVEEAPSTRPLNMFSTSIIGRGATSTRAVGRRPRSPAPSYRRTRLGGYAAASRCPSS